MFDESCCYCLSTSASAFFHCWPRFKKAQSSFSEKTSSALLSPLESDCDLFFLKKRQEQQYFVKDIGELETHEVVDTERVEVELLSGTLTGKGGGL